jgi:hypothetical protein
MSPSSVGRNRVWWFISSEAGKLNRRLHLTLTRGKVTEYTMLHFSVRPFRRIPSAGLQ